MLGRSRPRPWSGRFPGKSLINGLLLAPMIVPVIIIAVATFGVFLRWQLVGTFTGFLLTPFSPCRSSS